MTSRAECILAFGPVVSDLEVGVVSKRPMGTVRGWGLGFQVPVGTRSLGYH